MSVSELQEWTARIPWPLVALGGAVIFLLWLAREPAKALINAVFRRIAAGFLVLGRGIRSVRASVLEGARDQAHRFNIERAERRADAHGMAVGSFAERDLERMSMALEDIKGRIADTGEGAVNDLEAAQKRQRTVISQTRRDFERLTRAIERRQQGLETIRTRMDAFHKSLEDYRALLERPERKDAMKHGAVMATFLVSILTIPLIAGGGLLNFQLIARPMAEIVGSSLNVAGYPIYQIAALVMIALEAAAGIIFFDAVGVTRLFGIRERIQDEQVRRGLAIGAGVLLLVLACLEAGLAVVREFILAGERAAEAQLLGAAPALGESEAGGGQLNLISMAVQATLGFIIPFLLALIAIPLELFIETMPIVVGFTYGHVILGPILVLCLAVGVIFQIVGRILLTVYDVVIFLPEKIRQTVVLLSGGRRRSAERAAGQSAHGGGVQGETAP